MTAEHIDFVLSAAEMDFKTESYSIHILEWLLVFHFSVAEYDSAGVHAA